MVGYFKKWQCFHGSVGGETNLGVSGGGEGKAASILNHLVPELTDWSKRWLPIYCISFPLKCFLVPPLQYQKDLSPYLWFWPWNIREQNAANLTNLPMWIATCMQVQWFCLGWLYLITKRKGLLYEHHDKKLCYACIMKSPGIDLSPHSKYISIIGFLVMSLGSHLQCQIVLHFMWSKAIGVLQDMLG